MPQFNFENLLKIMFSMLIIMGLSDITSYYYQFGIPIMEYLDFTEIVNVFLSHIWLYSNILFSVVLFFTIKRNRIINILLVILALVILMAFPIINGDLQLKPNIFYFSSILGFNIGVIIIKTILVYKKMNFSLPDNNNIKWAILFLILIGNVILISVSGIIYADSVKRDHLFKGTSITINNIEIKSNDSCYYIGKTHGYVFFYNEKDTSAIIYPVDKLERVIFKIKNL
jgi:hypothetical protein